MQQYGSLNRDVLKMTLDDHGNRVYDPTRLALLKELCKQRYNALLSGTLDSDPLKVFVKQEPHKSEKLQEGRYRLIIGTSLVDTMVDRILFGELVRTVTSPNALLRTPCALGWAPNKGGWRYISMHYRDGFSIDRKAWDWSVTEWQVNMWEKIMIDLCVDPPSWWINMVQSRFTCLFYTARFSFPDGLLVQQQLPGIMKSGCYLTILWNSIAQTILHVAVQIRLNKNPYDNLPLCMGDDTLQRPFDYTEEYAIELNKLTLIKEAELTRGFAEFIGFLFTPSGYIPAYWKKHLFMLRHLDPVVARETLISYQMLYYHNPSMLRFIREIAWNLDPEWVLPDSVLCENANN